MIEKLIQALALLLSKADGHVFDHGDYRPIKIVVCWSGVVEQAVAAEREAIELDLQIVATICHGQGIYGEAQWLVCSELALCYVSNRAPEQKESKISVQAPGVP